MKNNIYFHKNLSALIEFYGISISQLGHKLNVSDEKIKSWTNGTAVPTYNQLAKLADCFKRPIIFFFIKDPAIQSFEIDFRSTQAFEFISDKKRLGELIDSITIYRASLEELFKDRSPTCKLNEWIKYYGRTDFNNYLRQQLKFDIQTQFDIKKPANVIEYLREQFYACGIYIFKDSFRMDDLSGLCAFDKDFPIILINNKVSFTRQLFTIFHELYHLLTKAFHIDILSDEESECDKFAGRFLIPHENLLSDISLGKSKYGSCEDKAFIEKQSLSYKVSRDAYAYQLMKQGAISKEFYFQFKQENQQYLIRSRQDDILGGNYYFTKMNYLGKSYLGEIITKYFAGKISLRYAAQFTQMKVPNVKKMLSMMSGGRY